MTRAAKRRLIRTGKAAAPAPSVLSKQARHTAGLFP